MGSINFRVIKSGVFAVFQILGALILNVFFLLGESLYNSDYI